MGMIKPKPGRLDDTIWIVLDVLAEQVDVPTSRLLEIATQVSDMVDPEAQRARILELAGIAASGDRAA